MPKDREDTTTVTGGPTQPEAVAPPTVAEMPAAVGPQTTPDVPVIDDEATRIDPSPVPKKVVKHVAKDDDDDDESTKHTGTPKKAREAQKLLEESRRMNAAGGPKPEAKKLHPLVPIGVAIALLAVFLMVVSWLVRSPSPAEAQPGAPQPGKVKSFFDW